MASDVKNVPSQVRADNPFLMVALHAVTDGNKNIKLIDRFEKHLGTPGPVSAEPSRLLAGVRQSKIEAKPHWPQKASLALSNALDAVHVTSGKKDRAWAQSCAVRFVDPTINGREGFIMEHESVPLQAMKAMDAHLRASVGAEFTRTSDLSVFRQLLIGSSQASRNSATFRGAPQLLEHSYNIDIGTNVSFGNNMVIYGHGNPLKIGNDVAFGDDVTISKIAHGGTPKSRPPIRASGVEIGDDTKIGAGVRIIGSPGKLPLRIGKNVLILPGSVVTKDIPDNTIFGPDAHGDMTMTPSLEPKTLSEEAATSAENRVALPKFKNDDPSNDVIDAAKIGHDIPAKIRFKSPVYAEFGANGAISFSNKSTPASVAALAPKNATTSKAASKTKAFRRRLSDARYTFRRTPKDFVGFGPGSQFDIKGHVELPLQGNTIFGANCSFQVAEGRTLSFGAGVAAGPGTRFEAIDRDVHISTGTTIGSGAICTQSTPENSLIVNRDEVKKINLSEPEGYRKKWTTWKYCHGKEKIYGQILRSVEGQLSDCSIADIGKATAALYDSNRVHFANLPDPHAKHAA